MIKPVGNNFPVDMSSQENMSDSCEKSEMEENMAAKDINISIPSFNQELYIHFTHQ